MGLAFSVLNLVQKNYQAIRDNFSISTELTQLQQRLLIDLNRYHQLIYNNSEQELILTNPVDTINYNFSEGLVVRESDTIHFSVKEVQFFFEGEKVEGGKIDALKIFFNEPVDSFIFLFKKNDARTYFK